MSRERTYHFIHFLIIVLYIITAVAVSAGIGPFSQYDGLPGGGATLFGGFVVTVLGGLGVVRWLLARNWRKACQAAGLTATGDGLYPTFEGTIDGQRVRASVQKEHSVGDDGSSTFTVIEADLGEAIERGAVVSHTRSDGPDFEPFPISDPDGTASDRELVSAGDRKLAPVTITGEAGDALAAVDDLAQVYAGDAGAVIHQSRLGEGDSSPSEGYLLEFQRAFHRLDWGDNPSTVAHVSQGVVANRTAIDQQTAAVAAVADAVKSVI